MFAVELFERQLNGKDRLAELGLGREEYERLLRMAFVVADRMHENLMTLRAIRPSAQ